MRFLTSVLTSLTLLTVLLASTGCDWPRDPEGTLHRIDSGVMRVGVIATPPWVDLDGAEPMGVEVTLIRRWANAHHTQIQWIQGGETELLNGLEHYTLDLVIGGLANDTPWVSRVGLTRPYYTEVVEVAYASGTIVPAKLAEQTIGYPRTRPAYAHYIRALHATPQPVDMEASARPDLLILPAWSLAATHYQPTGTVLFRREHVMAVPPGENAWLFNLETFLRDQASSLPALLATEALQ